MEKEKESDYIKVTHPKGETWVVFEKSVMNMYCDEASAKGLADTLNKKNVEPDTKYVVEKFTPSQPSEHNPPVDPLSVRADAVYNKRRTEDERNFERVKELLSEPLNVKGATARDIFKKHSDKALGEICPDADFDSLLTDRNDEGKLFRAVLKAMQEYSTLQRNEAIKSIETLMKASKRGFTRRSKK